MTTRIQLVQGDTLPAVVVALADSNTQAPIDVSDAGTTLTFKFRAAGTTTVLQTITGFKLPYAVTVDGTLDMSITTPGKGGRVSFPWPDGALSIDPGNYEGEVVINFLDGTQQTVWDILLFNLRAAF